MLSKEQILQSKDRKPIRIPTPEWAEPDTNPEEACVYARGLTGDQWAALGEMTNEQAYRWSIAYALCNEAGESLGFTEAEVALLGQKSNNPLQRIYEAIQFGSGQTIEAQIDTAKNYETTQTDGSGST